MESFFQAGMLVEDLDASVAELSAALGLRFGPPVDRDTKFGPMRVCFSLDGPPWIELIQGPVGSPWEPKGGSQLHHIGYWTDDLAADRARMDALGMELEIDGEEMAGLPYAYFRAPTSGLRVELLHRSMHEGFYERWGIEDPEKSAAG